MCKAEISETVGSILRCIWYGDWNCRSHAVVTVLLFLLFIQLIVSL